MHLEGWSDYFNPKNLYLYKVFKLSLPRLRSRINFIEKIIIIFQNNEESLRGDTNI